MSKRYSNKGYNARNAAQAQPKTDKSALIVALVSVFLGVVIIAAVAIAIGVASNSDKPNEQVNMTEVQKEIDSFEVSDFVNSAKATEYVKITVKDYGDIVIRLRPDVAPTTVKNFQTLVKDGHFEGKTFHRVIKDFMIQGGGYTASGTLDKAATIKGEFKNNGVQNDLLHVRGVISMARTSLDKNSGSSQFFICDKTSSHLDGDYAAFGYVLAGMDTVDKIAAVKTDGNDKPLENVIIEKVSFVIPMK